MTQIKLIDMKEWMVNEKVAPIFLCETPLSVSDVEDRVALKFNEHHEDGLGKTYISFISINGKELFFKGFLSKQQNDAGVTAFMHSDEGSPIDALKEVLNLLSLEQHQLKAISKHMGSPKFSLTRLDDNNNEVEMARFHDRTMAESLKNFYDEKGHKQIYFVTEVQ